MTKELEVPVEAVEAFESAMGEKFGRGGRTHRALKAAATFLREQERQRVREALLKHPEIQGREAVCEWIDEAIPDSPEDQCA